MVWDKLKRFMKEDITLPLDMQEGDLENGKDNRESSDDSNSEKTSEEDESKKSRGIPIYFLNQF